MCLIISLHPQIGQHASDRLLDDNKKLQEENEHLKSMRENE